MTCNNIFLSQPEAGEVLVNEIPNDASARLNFGPDDIAGLQIGDAGELIITLINGGQLKISNFEEVVDNGNLLYLDDNTLVDPTILTGALKSPQEFNNDAAAGADAVRIGQPAANTTQEISMQAGQKYVCDFDPANAATVELKDGQMVLTFADGSQVVINNYAQAMAGQLPAELTIADGAVVNAEEMITQVTEVAQPIEEILQFAQEEVAEVAMAQQVANIEPAAGGDDAAQTLANIEPSAGVDNIAQTLANIEPAAGETGSTGNTGYGFNSSPIDVPLNSPLAIGPLGPTQLAYQAPQFISQQYIPQSFDSAPTSGGSTVDLDETNLSGGDLVGTGTVNVDFGADGPGSITPDGRFNAICEVAGGTLSSGGVAVDVTPTADGYVGVANGVTVFTFVIDAATGEYVYTQLEPFDHADTSDDNEAICLDFGIRATDSDGDAVATTVRVNILDDAPTVLSQVSAVVDETNFVNGQVSQTGKFEVSEGQDVDATYTGTGSNSFSATGSVDNGALTSNGVPVVVTFDATTNTYTGAANGVTVFTMVLDATTGEYTYTQFEPLDHADASDPDDVISLNFGVTVTDYDGDAASGHVTVNVHDDAPVAGDDSNTIDETDLNNPIVVNDSVDVDFGNDGQGALVPNGTFTSTGSKTNGQLTSGGVAVVVTQTANGYVGVANGVTVFTLEIDPTNGDYTFTLNGVLDHADGTDANDVISLNFGAVVIDYDGDRDPGTITINIKDDAPVAYDDKISVENGDKATGNVIDNDEVGFDGSTVTKVTFEGQDYDVPAGGSVAVQGDNGVLTMNSDGSYEYDAVGGAETQTVQQFEVSNPAGGDGAGSIEVAKGSFNETTEEFTFSFTMSDGSADGATLVLNAGGNPKGHAGELAQFYIDNSGAEPVISVYGYNGLGGVPGTTASAFDGSQEDGIQTPDRIATSLAANSPFTNITVVTNADGSQTFSFSMDATALNDYAPINSVDGATWQGVSFGDEVGAWFHPVSGLQTDYNADGYLTQFDFTGRSGWDSSAIPTNEISVSGEDTFTYEITDGDGDTSTADLDIGVENDPTPTGIYGLNYTDDTNVNDNGVDAVTGEISVNYNGDTAGFTSGNGGFYVADNNLPNGVLSHNGVPIDVTFDAVTNTYTGVAGNLTVFTMVINADATYTFTQLESIDHSNTDAKNETIFFQFGVTATDSDGDTGDGVVQIRVRDDWSNAKDDSVTLDESETATGNVINNDDLGADETSTVTSVSFNGVDYSVPTTGSVDVTGDYGVLTIKADGSYRYKANNTNADGQDQFIYTLTDGDGDTDTANLNVNVHYNDVPTIEQFNNPYSECGIVDGPIVIKQTLTHDFGNDGAGAITPTGEVRVKFVLGGPLETLTSGGNDVAFTQTADGYVGVAGGETVISLIIDPATGEYTYTQFAAVDHPEGVPGDKTIWVVFGVQIADADGDTASTYIVIDISDGEPVAHEDANAVAEGEVATGNILDNDENCADTDSAVCEVKFGNQTFDVPATGSLRVTGQYGVLTIKADGSYRYKANNNNPDGVDEFTYTMKDADGDTSTSTLSITVTHENDVPTITSSVTPVNEADLCDNPMVVNKTLVHDFGDDGAGSITVNGNTSVKFQVGGQDQTLTANGTPVAITQNGNGYVGTANGQTIFTLTLNSRTGEYTYTQLAGVDHPGEGDDVIWLKFGVTITDSDGDTAQAYVVIDVRDSVPEAHEDVDAVAEGETATGNILGNDENCADTDSAVCEVKFGNQTFDVPATGSLRVTGQYGVLTIKADGSYRYKANNNNPDGVDEFTYTMKDADGDTSTSTLSITVTHENDVPTISSSVRGVNEVVLINGPAVVNKTLVHDFGDDGAGSIQSNGIVKTLFKVGGTNQTLTSNGREVVITETANGYVGVANGETIFTLSIDGQTGEYTYTQFAAVDHPGVGKTGTDDVIWLKFGVTITDSDGDDADAFIQIDIRDDAPEAHDDDACVNGNVLSNDQIPSEGADLISVSFGGRNYKVPENGAKSVQGANGVLTIHSNGEFTYQSTAGLATETRGATFNISDVTGFQSSITKDGITVSSNSGQDLSWHSDAQVGSGVGITGGLASSDKVYGSSESLKVSFADPVDEATFSVGDMGYNNLGSSFAYKVHLADGSVVSETVTVNANKVTQGIFEFDVDGYASDITRVDLIGGPSFVLNEVTTRTDFSEFGDDRFTYTIRDGDGDTSTATLNICAKDFDNVIEIDGNGRFYGTSDADLFLFNNLGNVGAALLKDFDAGEDSVDLSTFVQGYDPLTDAINDFVYVKENNGDTIISVDQDGAGGSSTRDLVARLDDVTGESLDDLLAKGSIVI